MLNIYSLSDYQVHSVALWTLDSMRVFHPENSLSPSESSYCLVPASLFHTPRLRASACLPCLHWSVCQVPRYKQHCAAFVIYPPYLTGRGVLQVHPRCHKWRDDVCNCLMDYLVFSMCTLMPSANTDSFSFSFPIWILLFVASALPRTSTTVVNNSGESGHPCLIPPLEESFSFTIRDVSCGTVIYSPHCAQLPSFYTWCLTGFILKDVLFCQTFSQHLLRWSYGFYPLFYQCGESYWLIHICWTILASQG